VQIASSKERTSTSNNLSSKPYMETRQGGQSEHTPCSGQKE
jgi:hypothetical protein